jgi:chromosomal replication initiator protein
MNNSAELSAAVADARAIPSSRDIDESWRRSCRRLRAELGENVFNSWFGCLKLDSIEGDRAQFSVPTRFLKSWIEAHYSDRILAALEAEISGVASVAIGLRSSMGASVAPPAATTVAIQPKAIDAVRHTTARVASASASRGGALREEAAVFGEALASSPLDRRLTFASFLVGRSNQLAHSAAQRVAEDRAGQTPAFSPLYVHSAVGLGKTHLLQATAQAAAAQGRSIIYLTAERFMYGFVAALQSHTAIAFKEAMRSIDLLIIDDVQFLQGKAFQNEFGHALNALLDSGRQVVVAADRPPADLEALDERVRSRLAGGLCVEMTALDEPLRMKILEARIAAARTQNPQFSVSPAVVSYVARSVVSNGRDLEGAVNRLIAHSIVGTPLTVEAAESAIRDLVRAREPRRVKIEDIQKLVASHYSVSRSDILSARRTAMVVKPRQVAMYLSKALTLRSLPEIGRRFGGRDHTTVLHAVRKLLKRMLQD